MNEMLSLVVLLKPYGLIMIIVGILVAGYIAWDFHRHIESFKDKKSK